MAHYPPKTEDNKCIFCEIASGRLSTAFSFWENEEFMAVLAIDPNTPGFTCVIPKAHHGSDVMKMPDDVLQRFIVVAKQVAAILENYYEDVGRVGVVMEGMGVDHAHIKLMPMHGTEWLKDEVWHQNFTEVTQWFDKYEGFISSAGGPLAKTEDLNELCESLTEFQKKID